jgi:Leucine-rich repeat (LRR) protein
MNMARMIAIAFTLSLALNASGVGQDRILHFPQDQPCGSLSVSDAPSPGEDESGPSITGQPSPERAQGDMAVPEGKVASLILYEDTWYDPEQLVALKNLRPDDLFGLAAYRGMSGVLKPNDRCMPHIAHLTGLRVLNMIDTNVTDKGASCLTQMRGLEQLVFRGRITRVGLESISRLPSLRRLEFSSTQAIDDALPILAPLTNLEALTLSGKTISDEDLSHLDQFPALQYLSLSGGFTDAVVPHLRKTIHLRTLSLSVTGSLKQDKLAPLSDLHELRALTIGGEIDDAALAYLGGLDRLEETNLSYPAKVGDAGVEYLSGISALKRLSLGNTVVTDGGMASLARLSQLQSLSLSIPELTAEGLRHLSSLHNLKKLSLDVKKLAADDQALADALRSLEQLEDVSFSMPIGEPAIAALGGLPRLERLTLSVQTGTTNAAVAHLGKIGSLRYLSLDCRGQISTGGLHSLGGLSQLETLQLSDLRRDPNAIDLTGLVSLGLLSIRMHGEQTKTATVCESFKDEDLACLAGLTKLEILSLAGTGVGDEGVAHLRTLRNLKSVSIMDASLTDQGLSYVSNLESLTYLRIHGGDFTDEGIAHLQRLNKLGSLELTSRQPISGRSTADLQVKLPDLTRITIDSPQLQTK